MSNIVSSFFCGANMQCLKIYLESTRVMVDIRHRRCINIICVDQNYRDNQLEMIAC